MQRGYTLLEMVQRGLFDYFYDHNRVVLEGLFQPPRPMPVLERTEAESADASEGCSLGDAHELECLEGVEPTPLRRRLTSRSGRISKARRGRRQSLKGPSEVLAD